MSAESLFGGADWRGWSLKVGRIRGIDIRVHWMLLALFAFLLLSNYLRLTPEDHPFTQWFVFVAGIFLSVLVHELAHCYAAFRQGGGADQVLLWPLGGLAYCSAPQEPRAQFWVAAAGPLSDALKSLAAVAVCLSCGWELLPAPTFVVFSATKLFFQYLFLWNAILCLINVLPCLPLDGGRMFQAASWSALGSHGQATLLALRVGFVTAIVSLAAGAVLFFLPLFDEAFHANHPFLYHLDFGLILIGLLYFYEARAIRHRLAYGEEEDGVFGYDFSFGYTSLDRTATRERKRAPLLAGLRRRLRERDQEQKRRKEELLRSQLDQVLAKISRDGMESLSRQERRFLERASKKLRK